MAQYTYRCEQCGDEMDVTAPLGEPPKQLPCATCGGRYAQVIHSPLFMRGSANAEDTFNHSLGIVHRTDQQAKEHIKKVNDTQGTNYTLT